MGPKEEAEGEFEGQKVLVTPLIGKVQLQVQGYVDSEDFHVLPLSHFNVLLGAPWFISLLATLSYLDRFIKLQHRGRDISIHVNERGHSIPLVSPEFFNKAIKKSIFACMIYVKDSMSNSVQKSLLIYHSSQEELSRMTFLDEFDSNFIDSFLGKLF